MNPDHSVETISQQGDSLIYNASYVSDLNGIDAVERLRRFPETEVKGGQIIISGQSVHRTYLDGALILGIVD